MFCLKLRDSEDHIQSQTRIYIALKDEVAELSEHQVQRDLSRKRMAPIGYRTWYLPVGAIYIIACVTEAHCRGEPQG